MHIYRKGLDPDSEVSPDLRISPHMSERFDKREQVTRTKQLPEALNNLQAQIQAHRKHDKRESWLGSAIGFVTTLNSSSNQSLSELEELKKKAENELKSGDKKASAELSAEIARK